ncbi:hypothetical protein REH65_13215 [Saccharopolyspora sp. ID03-671]|uniref:hypothetical protein n=1 Tax=Saccharopolyspora sp. ID03-671 TaxID=3073066 RepID=UPI0032505A0B
MSDADTSGRTAAVIFAVIATLGAFPAIWFTGVIGIWAASVPCDSGSSGTCLPVGVAAIVAVLFLLAAPILLWIRVVRPGSTGGAVATGLITLIVAPLLALGAMSLGLAI